jgi:uncharacterized membrane protein YtjA (UPF0391 family)
VSEQSEVTPARRPVFLVIALVALGIVGLKTATEGFAYVEIVRNPASALGTLGGEAAEDIMKRAFIDGVLSIAHVALPLGLAEVLLGLLLLGVVSRALFARRASPWFALQVILANAAVLIIGYALWQPVRGRLVEAWVHGGMEQRPAAISQVDFDRLMRLKAWWTFRFQLGLQLAVLGLGGLAVTRRSAREVLARPEPTTEEH